MRKSKAPKLTWLVILSMAFSMCASFLPLNLTHAEDERSANEAQNVSTEFPVLARYATDLTLLARQKKLKPVIANGESIDRTIEILSGTRHPVLIEDTLAAREIAEGVARRIAAGKVPAALLSKRLFSINTDAFFAGLKTTGEVDARFQFVIDDVQRANGEVILFLDQLYQFIGSRASHFGSNYLKAALDNGKVRVIGAARTEAYSEYIAQNSALKDLFQPVRGNSLAEHSSELDGDATESNRDGFEGDKISSDLRELVQNSTSKRVRVILQANDIRSAGLREMLKSHGVEIKAQMNELDALAVELPVSAVERLADSNLTSYISLDRETRASQLLGLELGGDGGIGHLENTTGAIAMRAQSGNSELKGDPVNVAVVDSGLFRDHDGMNRVIYEKDFTGDGKGTVDNAELSAPVSG